MSDGRGGPRWRRTHPDGDRITQLTMAVVGLPSDAAFLGVSRVVDVRSIDDDLLPTGASGVPR